MRIAIFTDASFSQISGVTRTLAKYMEYLDNNHIKYKILTPKGSKMDNTTRNEIIKFKSLKFIFYPECRLAIPSYNVICKELDNFKPDIIHIITEFSVGLFGLKYAKSRNIPVVSSYETNIPKYLEYYHFKFLENKSWKFFKWFHNSCSKTYCPSYATMRLLKNRGISNVDIWGREVETAKFSPDFRDENFRKALNLNNKVVFLYVGRISPEKNLKMFLNVAERINQKYADKVHFLIVGDGPSMGSLKKKALFNMTFTGYLSGIDLSRAYASSDVFLFTSSTETLGLVLIEAMASGLAVVACNSGGASDNLINGYNCIACRENNENDFYSAAEKLILNTEYRLQLSKNAKKYASLNKPDNSFNKLLNDYKSIINNH